MGEARKKSSKHEMGFTERLQSDATDIVRDAQYLIDSKAAEWKSMLMPDGSTWIGLMFPPSIWELNEGKISIKQPTNREKQVDKEGE